MKGGAKKGGGTETTEAESLTTVWLKLIILRGLREVGIRLGKSLWGGKKQYSSLLPSAGKERDEKRRISKNEPTSMRSVYRGEGRGIFCKSKERASG